METMASMLGVQVCVCMCVCAPRVSSASAGQLMGICAWSSGRQPANWANWATSASHRQLCRWSALHQRRYFSFTHFAQSGHLCSLHLSPSLLCTRTHPALSSRWPHVLQGEAGLGETIFWSPIQTHKLGVTVMFLAISVQTSRCCSDTGWRMEDVVQSEATVAW